MALAQRAGLACILEIVLGLIATPTAVGWPLFLLYRYLSVRHVHKLIERGHVQMKITMRGTEVTVWREERKPATTRRARRRGR